MAKVDDGFPTTLSLLVGTSGDTVEAVLFWEKTIKPPGIVGGGANDTTTMRNVRWRTRNAKKLLTLSAAEMTAAYDPSFFDAAVALAQQNRRWEVEWPDGSRLRFWGWMDEFDFEEIEEGSQPEVSVTVEPSNQNHLGAEVEPEYFAPPS